MALQTQTTPNDPQTLPGYSSILLALDSSDHANRGTSEAIALARLWGARITGCHAYAAKLHDNRFRQMEGGLPEQYRQEQELERQREVHDSLITRGLSIITDSYLDQADRDCKEAGIEYSRCSLEGKNYNQLAKAANSGGYDLLVMGALGLGAIQGSRLGTVCLRVARRSNIDTLVIKEPERLLSDGPIMVAVDGSPLAYGGLLTALSLGREWGVPVKVVAAFDPYYHYVAFNRIAGVLSEEADKVFRFQEQEKLHEEIIDSGLAKIYASHLEIAKSIATDHGMEIETTLLDGKAHDAVEKFVAREKPSLLIIGKTGIHADEELDIGGNAELILHNVDCAVLLSQREFTPSIDKVAATTTSWTEEAEARMERVPSFVRNMAKMAILRYAQERGHTVITESIVEEATKQLMPNHAEKAMEEIVAAHDAGELASKPIEEMVMRWSDGAKAKLLTVEDHSLRGNLSMRAEKKARQEGSKVVEERHIAAFLESREESPAKAQWQAAALARLMRVPEGMMRDTSRERIEEHARKNNISEITLAVVEECLTEARKAMEAAMAGNPPAAELPTTAAKPADKEGPEWTAEATGQLQAVPAGFCREMTAKAVEAMAAQRGLNRIDNALVEQALATFRKGSGEAVTTMEWDQDARERIGRAPDMVRGMLEHEIENWAKSRGLERVDSTAVDAVKRTWEERGLFHLAPNDPRNPA